MSRPHDEVGRIMSQPSARELPGTPVEARNRQSVSRAARRATGAAVPASEASIARAKSPTASAVPNRPEWPAAPPSAQAFSSWTSPARSRPRQGSRSVGARLER